MKRTLLLCILLLPGFACLYAQPSASEVKAIMGRVAEWQIEHFRDVYSSRPAPHHPLHWTNAALYVGMEKWARVSGDERVERWLRRIGDDHEWKLHERMYHADDHAVGQMYLAMYERHGDEKMLKPTRERFDYILHHPAQTSLEWNTPFHRDRWNWCDALFMAPPVLAKLYQFTGDQSYLDFLMQEFQATTDFLFDPEEKLYFRDGGYINRRAHGKKIFWSRGNGWVFAGLVNVMNALGPDSEPYQYFRELFEQMAASLIKLQTPEGHWAMSLLAQEEYPTPETSGTGFFTYGLAWGINEGILDSAAYVGATLKGWQSLVSHVNEEGMLGYVQPTGAGPGMAWPNRTEVYGTGAFLCAGYEMLRLLQGQGGHSLSEYYGSQGRFFQVRNQPWKTVFFDSFDSDWQNQWTLDGKKATISHSSEGMDYHAGSKWKDDAHHAVLWTKQSFKGDLRIDYTYTKLDESWKGVNILYVQATGSGAKGYDSDIAQWADKRRVPTMSKYFRHMNTLHISYAAHGGSIESDYVRARRYLPEREKGLAGTALPKDYVDTGLFDTNVPYHITVIKKEGDLFMFVRNEQKELLCHWKLKGFPPITQGRIGLRHMYTRGARYSDFRISQLSSDK